METTGVGRQVERQLARILVSRRGVPYALVAIPVHRSFEEKPVGGKEISAAAMSRADGVK
jgi:hypothetical protein